MSKLRVQSFTLSVDGYGAGPDQSLEEPLGKGGVALHEWMFATRTAQRIMSGSPALGKASGETGIDDDFAARGFDNVGAWIIGRNMFGPVRGPWPDESWRGWWGENPPYHTPVFVLTHHARTPLEMAGGTTFYFVTDGIESALRQARSAAKSRDVRLGGGVSTLRQYLTAHLIDELHLALSSVLLGCGESLFAGLDLPRLGYRCARQVPGERATHIVLTRA
jgi:dihydrofolate reductase